MIIAEPRVTLLASTGLEYAGGFFATEEWMKEQPEATHAEELIEFAGRACYQSFHRPNPATAKNADYLTRTLFGQGHWSIAEHATATLYFEGVSRAFTHELIRHRHLSYSQLSQRFVDESDAAMVLPPAIKPGTPSAALLEGVFEKALVEYGRIADELTKAGLPRKQAREAARAVLPNATETRIVVTGNLRAWHEVIQRRTAPDADAEMQHVMGMAHKQLAAIAPTIFPTDD